MVAEMVVTDKKTPYLEGASMSRRYPADQRDCPYAEGTIEYDE